MKKLAVLTLAFSAIISLSSKAQEYKTSVGVDIDFGDGVTLFGPSVKHFLGENTAIKGDVLFGSHYTMIQAAILYQKSFEGSSGLNWYLGGGPSIGLYSGGSDFFLRPMAGLEFKIPDAPVALSFDWRPMIYLGSGGDRFTAARFGLGFKYTLRN